MNIQGAIRAITEGHDLSREAMITVMRGIMTGQATPAQIGGFLIGMRMKGETVDELVAAATVMRDLATPVDVSGDYLVDTCGTGGDGAHTFNISTASAIVAAAAGAKVAKHGNRSVSSRCGSADVLEAAGVNLDLGPNQVARCVQELGVGFLFAPRHHSAMKHAIGPRKVVGVFSEQWLEPLAQVLQRLGSNHVLVVHADDGLDEISIGAPTQVVELKDGRIDRYRIAPADFGITAGATDGLVVQTAEESLALIDQVFAGQPGPARDIVVLNAGAAVYAAGLSETLAAGVERAAEVIGAGLARERFAALIEFSHQV
jgi:anthranilate phosphoribosyltransferase